jgi:CBS domain-containing protein
MTTRVITVLESTRLEEVAQTLVKWRISAVPVVDMDGKVVGIVSEGDLMSRSAAQSDAADAADAGRKRPGHAGARAHAHLAKDVMSTAVITADEDATASKLAATLEKYRIKRVPILRNGRLVGIVSRANLLHGLAALPDASVQASSPTAAPKRSASERDDPSIRASILNGLHNEVSPSGAINVIVNNGVVDLWGGVESEDERQTVLAVAKSSPGVVEVRDHLTDLSTEFRHLFDSHIWD